MIQQTAIQGHSSFKRNSVDTSGANITLNAKFNSIRFVPSANIIVDKTFIVNANSSTFEFVMRMTLTAGVVLTWPANFRMGNDPDWNAGANTWTTPLTGEYEAHATYDGTNWNLTITGLYN